MPDPDPVAAWLAEVRERAARRLTVFVMSARPIQATIDSAADVPPLLAAVEAVLEKHQRQDKPVVEREICARHGGFDGLRALRFSWKRDQIDACPDCVKTERYVCACCRRECPSDDEWPCPTYRAVSAALLGKENDAC